MVIVTLFKELVGLDLSLSTTANIVRENFLNTDAGRWVIEKNMRLDYVPHQDYENFGLILEFFAYMNEEDAAEFIVRFK